MRTILQKFLNLLFLTSFITVSLGSQMFAASRLRTLYSFTGGRDGAQPVSTLLADQYGNLYGTTSVGGGATACSDGCGTIFKFVAPSTQSGTWTEKTLYRFTGGTDGLVPRAGLIADAAGNLYGTTSGGGNLACEGGCGTVFELARPTSPSAPWTLSVLHSFNGTDGAYSQARLTFDSEGNLYGTAYGGGAGTQCATGNLVGCGVVFELSPPALQGGIWNYSLLYSFGVGTLSDGVLPIADLIFDQLGNLY